MTICLITDKLTEVMRSLQDEIIRAQQELSCPVCGRKFTLRDISVLPSFGKAGALELSIMCSKKHFPVVMMVPIHLGEMIKAGPITSAELKTAFKRIDSVKISVKEIFNK